MVMGNLLQKAKVHWHYCFMPQSYCRSQTEMGCRNSGRDGWNTNIMPRLISKIVQSPTEWLKHEFVFQYTVL